jgi:molecular chaperone HtpG
MPDNVIIGVNILEILTTGMYRDSRVIFREYIQNSCDQIDAAVRSGLLAPGKGQVELWIDSDKRSVSIEDNATGIPASLFKQTLYSIGESTKILGEDKGFRGIGHWCGLGYCKTLVFTSKVKGENVESIMSCDAELMRQMMDDHNSHKARYTVDEVLTKTVTFDENKTKDMGTHFFKVEMIGVREVHTELCSLQQVKDYLSFVAPVGYDTAFHFRKTIQKHAELLKQPIQEYNISVNGPDSTGGKILKKYKPTFTTSKGEDKITEVDFHDFKDDDGNLIAWLWFGISRFQGVLLKNDNPMRGIRLRSQNIQIGDSDTLQKLFREDRGQNYFVGEVFAVTKDLIPNSQRDYFNENEARLQFERLLSEFFNDDLSRIYKAGSSINSKFDKIEKAEKIETEIAKVVDSGGNVPEEQRVKLERAQKEAEGAAQELAKIREKNSAKLDSDTFGTAEVVVGEIFKSNEEKRSKRPQKPANHASCVRFSTLTPDKPITVPKESITPPNPPTAKPDKMVSLSKIREIIRRLADSSTANAIIAKIEEELD